jgi:hypothetical protein
LDNKNKVNYNTKFKKDMEIINVLDRETNNRIYGVNKDLIDSNKANNERVKDTINKVNKKYTQITGNNIIEFFNSSIYQNTKDDNKKSIKNKQEGNHRSTDNFNKALESINNTGLLNNVFFQEKERIRLYSEYQSIEYYIPIVHQAIEAIADAIISPDDYSKEVFEKEYGDSHIVDDNTSKKVLDNLEIIENIYDIEGKAKKWIRESLIQGDKFVSVLRYKDEFDKLLSEDGTFMNESTLLNEDNFILNESEMEILNELFENEDGKVNIKQEFVDMVNNAITFTSNPAVLFEDSIKVSKDFVFTSTDFNSSFESIKNTVLKKDKANKNTSIIDNANADKLIKDLNKANDNLNINPESNNKKKDFKSDINGSYIKELNPESVIKLKVNNTCFGYYYVEGSADHIKNFSSVNTTGKYTDIQLRKNLDFLELDDALANPKSKIVLDIFSKALSTKLNKKFIEDNKEFKQVIFELLKQGYITQKRVKIVFLKPEEVFHFRSMEGEDGYGISELKKVMFTCKLYLSVLISNLMMKLSRSVDHRAFYIETGLSNDVENVIQSFIRDIKTKEVKLSDIETIDTIFKSIGKFHDYCVTRWY